MHYRYDIIYSIGHDCACSIYLKEHGLRLTSGPVDWLTNASFEDRFDCLLNDFDGFMNIKDFRFLPKNPNVSNDTSCDYYENVKTHFYFYHDFPIGCDFKKTFPLVKEKYERRIARFYKNIREKDRILLVWLSHDDDTPDGLIVELCNKFCSKMKKQIDFVIIEHKENQRRILKYNLAPNIVKYRLHTHGKYITKGNVALINRVFKRYHISMGLGDLILHNLSWGVSKVVCPMMFFNKKIKQKLKNYLRGYWWKKTNSCVDV